MKTYRHELAAPSDTLVAAASEALAHLRHDTGPVGDRRVAVTMRARTLHGRARWEAIEAADVIREARRKIHFVDAVKRIGGSPFAIVVEDMLDVVLSQGDVGMRLGYAQDLAWALSIDVQSTEDFRHVGVVHVRLARFVELVARELATRTD